jgi:hypothetical protein
MISKTYTVVYNRLFVLSIADSDELKTVMILFDPVAT